MRLVPFVFLLLLNTFSFSQSPLKVKENAHEGGVNALAVSADGSILVTGGNDSKTYVWNLRSGDKLKGALKHSDKVSSVAISANNRFYASGSADMKIRVVDIELGVPVRVLSEHTAEVTSIVFHPLNDHIISGSKDNLIKVWDNSKSKTSIATLKGHEKEILSLTVSPDGKTVCSGSADNTLRLWSTETYQQLGSSDILKKPVTAVSFNPDGISVAAGSSEGDIFLLDLKGNKISELKGVKGSVSSLSFSGDGQYLLAGTSDKKVIIWKVQTGKIEKEISAHESLSVVSFSGSGEHFVSAGADGALKTWDAAFLNVGPKILPLSNANAKWAVQSLTLKDDNSNGILEAGEKASLQFIIKNTGTGAGFNQYVNISLDGSLSDVKFEKQVFIGNIDAGRSQLVSVPLTTGSELKPGNGTFKVKIADADEKLAVQAGGENSYSYIMAVGQSYSSATGKAEVGAPITGKLRVKNITKGEAKNVKVNFLLPENVFAVNRLSETIEKMAPGEEKEIQLDFYASEAFKQPEIKIGIDIQGVAFTNAKDILLKVKMNEALPKSEDYTSEAIAQSTEAEQTAKEETVLYRGGADPMKGLNVNKPKEMVIGKYYALIIGIDKYKGPWTPLVNAVNDARSIETMFKTKYKFDVVKTLYNEAATREGIISQFEWLIANATPNDNVMIYYSGHGEYKKELNRGYWVPVDAITASTSKYISNADIQTYINGIRSKHTLLISDACFSGDIFRGNAVSVPFEESEKYYREVHNLVSRQALTSGGVEPVMDGGKEGHSVFAYYLLKALESNQSKFFDASQVYTKVKIPVINNSEQTPKLSPIKNAGDEGGQFIFIKK